MSTVNAGSSSSRSTCGPRPGNARRGQGSGRGLEAADAAGERGELDEELLPGHRHPGHPPQLIGDHDEAHAGHVADQDRPRQQIGHKAQPQHRRGQSHQAGDRGQTRHRRVGHDLRYQVGGDRDSGNKITTQPGSSVPAQRRQSRDHGQVPTPPAGQPSETARPLWGRSGSIPMPRRPGAAGRCPCGTASSSRTSTIPAPHTTATAITTAANAVGPPGGGSCGCARPGQPHPDPCAGGRAQDARRGHRGQRARPPPAARRPPPGRRLPQAGVVVAAGAVPGQHGRRRAQAGRRRLLGPVEPLGQARCGSGRGQERRRQQHDNDALEPVGWPPQHARADEQPGRPPQRTKHPSCRGPVRHDHHLRRCSSPLCLR